ncbi:MAG: lytic transglycosylase domain-containing protein [Clostridia bacterium]|nr:lytic transglycosylase domain-containing protein [Clostridia bacterium]
MAVKKRHWIWVLVPLLVATVLAVAAPTVKKAAEKVLYPATYRETVEAEATQHGISPSLVMAVIHTESHFDPEAVSSAGARGLMQVTPLTLEWTQMRSEALRELTKEDLFEAEKNIRVGVYVLALLGESFSDTETVLAAYNAGIGTVSEWLEDDAYSADGETLHTIPYPETAEYVKKVTAAQKKYQAIYNFT